MVAWSRKLILACAACAFVGPAALTAVAHADDAPPVALVQPWRTHDSAEDGASGRTIDRLPDSFFADAGGVGPAFVESGSGQTVVFAYASGRAVASARTAASAEASVSVRLSGVARVRTGCGCRR